MLIKTTLLALAAFACVSTAQADSIYTFTGDTTGGDTFNRPIEDGSDLSSIGTDVAYRKFNFTVSTAGDYTFLTTATYDSFVFLYSPTFVSGSSLTNFVTANDDLFGTTTSGLALSLESSTPYVLVTTGFLNSDRGAFSTTIGGPGTVLAVPEPETAALAWMGLAVGVLAFARRHARPAEPA